MLQPPRASPSMLYHVLDPGKEGTVGIEEIKRALKKGFLDPSKAQALKNSARRKRSRNRRNEHREELSDTPSEVELSDGASSGQDGEASTLASPTPSSGQDGEASTLASPTPQDEAPAEAEDTRELEQPVRPDNDDVKLEEAQEVAVGTQQEAAPTRPAPSEHLMRLVTMAAEVEEATSKVSQASTMVPVEVITQALAAAAALQEVMSRVAEKAGEEGQELKKVVLKDIRERRSRAPSLREDAPEPRKALKMLTKQLTLAVQDVGETGAVAPGVFLPRTALETLVSAAAALKGCEGEEAARTMPARAAPTAAAASAAPPSAVAAGAGPPPPRAEAQVEEDGGGQAPVADAPLLPVAPPSAPEEAPVADAPRLPVAPPSAPEAPEDGAREELPRAASSDFRAAVSNAAAMSSEELPRTASSDFRAAMSNAAAMSSEDIKSMTEAAKELETASRKMATKTTPPSAAGFSKHGAESGTEGAPIGGMDQVALRQFSRAATQMEDTLERVFVPQRRSERPNFAKRMSTKSLSLKEGEGRDLANKVQTVGKALEVLARTASQEEREVESPPHGRPTLHRSSTSSLSTKTCRKCHTSYSGFGDTCSSCRRSGRAGSMLQCTLCKNFFAGFGEKCSECTVPEDRSAAMRNASRWLLAAAQAMAESGAAGQPPAACSG